MTFKDGLVRYVCHPGRWAQVKLNGEATFFKKDITITVKIHGTQVTVSGRVTCKDKSLKDFKVHFEIDLLEQFSRDNSPRYLSESNVIDVLKYPARLEAIKAHSTLLFRTSWYDYRVTKRGQMILVNVRKRSDPKDDLLLGQWIVLSLSRLETSS